MLLGREAMGDGWGKGATNPPRQYLPPAAQNRASPRIRYTPNVGMIYRDSRQRKRPQQRPLIAGGVKSNDGSQ
jgi:hypothetical protein